MANYSCRYGRRRPTAEPVETYAGLLNLPMLSL